MLYTSRYDSPLGGILLAGDDEALTGLWFDGQKYFADTLPAQHAARETPVFDAAKRWLDVYFPGERPDFTPPVKWEATPFRSAVWEILVSVPYGTTVTAQPDFRDRSVPPRCRHGRQPDGLCRRHREKAAPAGAGAR